MTMDRPSAELRELTEAASNGDLTPGDCARLEALLDADPAARRFYLRQVSLDADLWREASTGGLTGQSIPDGTVRSPGFTPAVLRHLVRIHPRRAAVAAVACLLIAASSFWLLLSPGGVWGGDRASDLTRTVGARWEGVGGEAVPFLRSGDRVRLTGGLAEYLFDCGARVILQAPAELEAESSRACRLLAGRAAVIAPEQSAGFTVRTSSTDVVGVSTEFGVLVDAGTTEVHALRGEVDVEPAGGAGEGSAKRESLRVRRGEALRVSVGRIEEIAAAPGMFLGNERLTEMTRRIVLREDFSTRRLDPGTWKTLLPSEDSALRIDGDRLELVNRGYLITAEEIDPVRLGGIRISGKWRFAPDPEAEGNGRVDILSVMTRSDGRVGRVYYEARSGIEFGLLSHEMVPRIRSLGPDLTITRPAIRGKLDAEVSDPLDFEIVDDGRDLSFTVSVAGDRSRSATATAAVIRDETRVRRIIFHNRENPHKQRHVSYLDDVVIESGVGPCP